MRYGPTLLLVLALPAAQLHAQHPRLGGSLEEFTSKWGQPVRSAANSLYDFQICPGQTALARWSITVERERVTTIFRNACPDEKLDPAESAKEVAAFMPGDATRPRPFQTEDGWSAEERRSATLGEELPAVVFTTCNGKAAPGTFSSVLTPERQNWILAVGTCL